MNQVGRIAYTLFLMNILSMNAHWSSVYHKSLIDENHAYDKTDYVFSREAVPLFSQLLFSWNAHRPKNGFLSFYVQVRDAHTHKWGNWHHMVDWGAHVQRSYTSKSDGISQFSHVRLDTEKYCLVDAFRIKVLAHKGASIGSLKSMAVSIANLHNFEPERWGDHIQELPTVYLPHVPKISQMALETTISNRICSPTSCTMLVSYLNKAYTCPLEFAKNSYDKGLEAFGSWHFNLAHAFEKTDGRHWFFNTRLNSFVDLHKQLVRGLPVVVSVRGDLPGAPQSFPNGHLIVVVGWDAKNKVVMCHDPSCLDHDSVEKQYKFNDFIKAWDRSRRLCYWVEPVR